MDKNLFGLIDKEDIDEIMAVKQNSKDFFEPILELNVDEK